MSETNRIDNLPATDEADMWCIPQLDTLRFLRARFVNHTFAPHSHDYYVIGIVEDGAQRFNHFQQRHITLPGQLIIINPGDVHTGESAVPEGFHYRALYPTAALLENVATQLRHQPSGLPLFPEVRVYDLYLHRQLRYLHSDSEKAMSALEFEARFIEFFGELIARHASDSGNVPEYREARREIQEVRDYMEANFATDISLTDLSELVNISSYHLARLFRREMGIPPHRYLENIRIRHAQHLLDDNLTIADVAYATGFSSQSHLTRTFRRFIGVTPGKFAQQRKIV
ncbi:MAG: AraC family transcriptional regulator [Chloroflexi bacterium]|nr:AraC family transcriptional regulator [Chloroflexota bacterium]